MALSMLALPARAQPVRDEASGLAVEAPPGYEVRRLPPRGPNTAIFGLRKPTDRDTGCQLAHAPAPQNRAYSQQALNETAGGEAWQGMARRTISGLFDIDHTETFEHAGIRGLLLEGRPRLVEAMSPEVRRRAGQVRMFFVLLETPSGRTTTVCVGEQEGYAARRMEFIGIVRSSTPPR
jgi:hypothetical protein